MNCRWSKGLVLGGARSGKSRFAESLAESVDADLVYIATAEVWDAEMADRIALHRSSRSTKWKTLEAPVGLADAVAASAVAGTVVLVDCLTLWLSNVMLSGASIEAAENDLVSAMDQASGQIILVSNEVGLGIVPDNALARRFRDAQGRLNQRIASEADVVVFLAAGLPLYLKGSLAVS